MLLSQSCNRLITSFYEAQNSHTSKTDSGNKINWHPFNSSSSLSFAPEKSSHSYFDDNPDSISLNSHFSYPSIQPESINARKGVIILLHGLNERKWDKYLPWADALADKTGKTVILFPIAHHMNRAPVSWQNPREMLRFVSSRNKRQPEIKELSVANVALSERLTSRPERFFLGGCQVANDLIQLLMQINKGKHPLLDKNPKLDFFGYSIGVLVLQVLLLANPQKLFSNSRYFFFCGGSVLESMHGISKYILDDLAYRKILRFYSHAFKSKQSNQDMVYRLLFQTQLGNAFHLLLSESDQKRKRNEAFSKAGEKIHAVGLTKDRVMQPDDIKNAMLHAEVEEIDFPYHYSHENPFPIYTGSKANIVDQSFENLFSGAANFLR